MNRCPGHADTFGSLSGQPHDFASDLRKPAVPPFSLLNASIVAWIGSPWPVPGYSQTDSLDAHAARRMRLSPAIPSSTKALRGRPSVSRTRPSAYPLKQQSRTHSTVRALVLWKVSAKAVSPAARSLEDPSRQCQKVADVHPVSDDQRK